MPRFLLCFNRLLRCAMLFQRQHVEIPKPAPSGEQWRCHGVLHKPAGFLCVVLLIQSFFVPAVLATPSFEGTFSGSDQRISGSSRATKDAALDIAWQVEARLGTLLGEPVVSLRFKYNIIAGIVSLPQLSDVGRTYGTAQFHRLPSKLKPGVRLIDVKLRMTFSDGVGLLDVVADVGAPGRPGEWSFNVPGSPDWDQLFRSQSLLGFLSEEGAKSAMAGGLTLVSAKIESATLSLYELHDAYMKNYGVRERYRVLGWAYNRLQEGLKRSYGIDAGGIENGWTKAYFDAEGTDYLDSPRQWGDRLHALQETLTKLSSLPEALRDGTNHGPYEQAVEDLRRLRLAATDATDNFEPDGVDPESLPKGTEPQFDSDLPRPIVLTEWPVDGRYSLRRKEHSQYRLEDDGSLKNVTADYRLQHPSQPATAVLQEHSESCSWRNYTFNPWMYFYGDGPGEFSNGDALGEFSKIRGADVRCPSNRWRISVEAIYQGKSAWETVVRYDAASGTSALVSQDELSKGDLVYALYDSFLVNVYDHDYRRNTRLFLRSYLLDDKMNLISETSCPQRWVSKKRGSYFWGLCGEHAD